MKSQSPIKMVTFTHPSFQTQKMNQQSKFHIPQRQHFQSQVLLHLTIYKIFNL